MLHPALAAERAAIRALLARSTERLCALMPQVERDADIEALHQFRVELRRIRSVLRVLEGCMPEAGIDELAVECRWLAGRSSGLRDFDVLQDRLEEYLGGAPPDDLKALRRLHREIGGMRAKARRVLLGSFRSRRAHQLLERLRAISSLSPHAPGWPAQAVAAMALRRALRKVVRHGRGLSEAAPPEYLHELRKLAKRLRYLLDMYAGVETGKQIPALQTRLRKLQNALGDYQDFATHGGLLEELRAAAAAAEAPDPVYLTLLERLMAALQLRAVATRKRAEQRFGEFLESPSRKRVARRVKPDPLLAHPQLGTQGYCHGWSSGERVALPVGKIVCVGRNYAAHAAELGNPVPERPLLFIKPPSAAVDFAPLVRVPTTRGSVHHELEVALLIGRELRSATPAQARAAIAGIGLALDLTLRELQDQLKAKAHPWELAKGFDGACPLSPFAPLDPALDLGDLQLRLAVNGRRRQFGSSAQMLTPIIELLCIASAQFSLWPGDVLLTGTPKGVGELHPGDRLSAELSGLVLLRSEIVA